jgi:hypothetical protein
MTKSVIQTNGYKLNATSYRFNNGTIQSNDTLEMLNTAFDGITLDGNYKIRGKLKTMGNVVMNGTVTILDTLQNEQYYTSYLTVNGKFVNKGKVIIDPVTRYGYYILCYNDIDNQGVWAPLETRLAGNTDQRLRQSAGKSYQGYFITTDTLGQIILDSHVTFDGYTWNMNKAVFKTGGFTPTFRNYRIDNAKFISNDQINFLNTAINEVTFQGDYKISGKLKTLGNVVMNGIVTILDTLQNEPFYTSYLTVNGKIINKGKVIIDPVTRYSYYILCYNDIDNQGIWHPAETRFLGITDQHLKQTAAKSFQGYFLTTDTLGQIILDSDVTFEGNTWDWNKSTLKTNGFQLTAHNYRLNNGVIISNDQINLKNTAIDGMKFYGNYKINGKTKTLSGNILNGIATILDTLQNEPFNTSFLTVNGKIINNGTVIKDPATGYALYMDVFGDIENNGIWRPQQTKLAGNTDQHLKQAAGKSFQGYFLTTDTLGQIYLDSPVTFSDNTWDMSKSKIRTNGFNMTTVNYRMNNGTIISNDQLNLDNSMIGDMLFFGNYRISKKLKVLSGNVFNGIVTILDTLQNEPYYTSFLTVNGKLINNGTILKDPKSGYALYLDIFGDIENNGVWKPHQTKLAGTADQHLKQSAGKSFQGYFLTPDTLGQIVLDSDVTFSGNTWDWSKSKMRTNGKKLTLQDFRINNGTILSNDTLFVMNSWLSGMTVSGNFYLAGKARLLPGNLFLGKATVLDTMYNEPYYTVYLTVNGSLVNEGLISNNPVYGYALKIGVSGDIENNKLINVSEIFLTGTGDRTIGGKSASSIMATVYVDNAINLVGTNYLPNMNFTGSAAGCTVKPGAILTIPASVNSTKIKNYGRITIAQDIDNTSAATWNFFAASASTKAKTPVNKLVFDNYGYQQHPTATGTVDTWWRVKNTPALYNDSLNWIKLNYSDDALNGNIEDSLKVFHSPNAGLTWKRIKQGITIDKTNNTVTVNKAPSYGHYLLSSSALGITSFQPLVETAEPRFGGNTGQLTMYIFGAGFKNSSTLSLKAGTTVIKADSTWVTDGIGESLQAKFNLKNKPLGIYDVVIETPGENTLNLPAWFTIEKGERSQPWLGLTGRDRFLINRWQTFTINYGNTSNTDALGTILVYVVNDLPGLEVEFPDVNIVMPKALEEMGPNFTRFRDSLKIYFISDTLSGYENQRMRIYPFYIPYIAAGTSKSVRVRVLLNGTGSLTMDSWMLDPLYEKIDYNLKSAEPMPAEVRACITAAAMKAWYNGMIGMGSAVVPGLACWSVIDKTVDPIGYITPEELKPEGKDTWGSWLWNKVSIMGSVVQCGASFVPGIGTALNLGIAAVNMAIDIKDGYDANEGCWRKFRKKSQNKLKSRGVTSFDPNEKSGPQGYTADHYISKEGNLNYTIYFENKKTAGAAALEVFIKDTLDIAKFDLSTFSFNRIAFGDTTVKIQEYAKEFRILVDMFPKKGIIVQVHGKLDTVSGFVSWDFHSLDRITLELTEDPDLGFLPPNVNAPEGEGNVTFSCKLKQSVSHGDQISNRASIIFDMNAPILTNTFSNKIDDRVPVSSVAPLSPTQKDSLFTVFWSGNDQGSKIAKYNIFVSKNDSAFVLWKVASLPGSAQFKGKNGVKYKFFSIATDSLGFAEAMKSSPEAFTTVDIKTSAPGALKSNGDYLVYPNPAGNQCSVSFGFDTERSITIVVEDISGKRVRSVGEKRYAPGKQTVDISLNGIADGIYFVRLISNETTLQKKLIVRR